VKMFHLIIRQYSKYFIRETVIMLLAAYLIYALTTAISPISYTLSLTDKIGSSILQSAVYFSPYDRVSRLIDGILGCPAEDRELMESKLNQGHIQEENIPVVIGGSFRKTYHVGDIFTLDLNEKYRKSIKCRVIAVLDERDIYFMFGYGATSPALDSLAVMNKWTYSRLNKNQDSLIIAPMDTIEFADLSDVSRGTLLFFDNGVDAEKIASEL
jgi:hypothetical protein